MPAKRKEAEKGGKRSSLNVCEIQVQLMNLNDQEKERSRESIKRCKLLTNRLLQLRSVFFLLQRNEAIVDR